MACVEDSKGPDGNWVRYFRKEGIQVFTRAGRLWDSVCTRSKEGGTYQLTKPSYVGCKNLFGNFDEFADWCQTQVGYLNKEVNGRYWALDKDLLDYNNTKSYSKDTCCFLPLEVNCLLNINLSTRGEYPLGVYTKNDRNKKYVAQIQTNGRNLQLGRFYTKTEAHLAWQKGKVLQLDLTITNWEGHISKQATEALDRVRQSLLVDILNGSETKYLGVGY